MVESDKWLIRTSTVSSILSVYCYNKQMFRAALLVLTSHRKTQSMHICTYLVSWLRRERYHIFKFQLKTSFIWYLSYVSTAKLVMRINRKYRYILLYDKLCVTSELCTTVSTGRLAWKEARASPDGHNCPAGLTKFSWHFLLSALAFYTDTQEAIFEHK